MSGKRYPDEFKIEAVKQITDRGYSIKDVSFRWIKAPDKYLHDRYFITDVGAIRSGQGFMPDVQNFVHFVKFESFN